jgi:hypothetical protein
MNPSKILLLVYVSIQLLIVGVLYKTKSIVKEQRGTSRPIDSFDDSVNFFDVMRARLGVSQKNQTNRLQPFV